MPVLFPDQRDHLFGREPAVRLLSERARQPGLTAVVARPLMGKTWTLLEVARRQVEGGDCLVGYHESKGSESSHLLYAVSNLYAGWLSDSSMREQAVSLWERHKGGLVPRIGELTGLLFEKLGGKLLAPEGVASVVRASFDGLARAQKDLLTGGLQMDPLSYAEALSITDLVAKISGRRVVLILDAWEKSPSMRAEFLTLEAFLKHLGDWPHTHVLLGIRSPDVQAAPASDDAFKNAGILEQLSPSALRYDLTPIDLSVAGERDRLVAYLHAQVPATGQLPGPELLKMVDGFPGVVSRWMSDVNRDTMRTVDDLDRQALTAQTLRYLEFDQLLDKLEDRHRTFAARLAFLPRMEEQRWPTFRQTLLGDASESIVDDLIAWHVLENAGYPTYGHDTRHAAARSWFRDNQINLTRRVAEGLVEKMASQVSGGDATSILFVGALAASALFFERVSTSPTLHCLVNAARSCFEETRAVFDPGFDDQLANAAKQNGAFVP